MVHCVYFAVVLQLRQLCEQNLQEQYFYVPNTLSDGQSTVSKTEGKHWATI